MFPKRQNVIKITSPEAKSLNGYRLWILPIGLMEHIFKYKHIINGETKADGSQVHCIMSQGD